MVSSANSLVLVTGAAGFVGARLVESLATEGKSVLSVDSLPYFTSRPELARFPFGTQIERDELFTWLEREKPPISAIAHLGACTDTTLLDVEHFRKLNLEYSQKFWSYAAVHQIPFVYASSAATYGDGAHGYSDDEKRIAKLVPLNPYGQSKQDFDLWALDQERQGNAPPAWAGFKFFNVYGYGERHKTKMSSVVLQAFDQIRSHGSVRLFKSYRPDIAHGLQKRDFIYVGDVVDVLKFAMFTPIPRGIFNLGSGTARSFLDLARAVFIELGALEQIEFIDMPPGLAERYQYFTEAPMEKLRDAGYLAPFRSLEAGVALYIKDLLQP